MMRKQRHRIALRGSRIARMKAHGAGRRFRQSQRVVAEHERVDRPLVGRAARVADRPRLCKDGDAFASQQPAHETGVRLVDLPRQLACRITFGSQSRQVEIERAREGGAALPPFVQQRAEDVDDVSRPEYSGIDAAVHQRQRIADAQLIHGQLAVGLTGLHVVHDRIDRPHVAPVGRQPDRHRQAEKQRGRQMGVGGYAGQLPVDSRHQSFANIGVMKRQQMADRMLRLPEMQGDRPVVPVDQTGRKVS